MATERIQIIVSSKGTVTVKRDIENIGSASKHSAGGVEMLRSALGAMAAVLSVQKLIEFADAGTRISNSLRVAGLEGEMFAQTQDRIYKTAIKNGQSTEALAAVYQKTSLVQKELGISGDKVIGVVEGIAAAMKLSTAGTSAQAGALQQLSQLLGGSIVQAQEYNSLIDGAFPLVQAAARGIDGMNGSVAKLTQSIKEGGFSSKVFFEGMMRGLQNTQGLAASLPLTFGQSVVAMREAFTQWLNSSTLVQASMDLLSKAVQWVAFNMDMIAPIIIPLIAILVVFAGATVIGAVISGLIGMSTVITATLIPALVRLTLFLATNPYMALLGVLGLLAAKYVNWGGLIDQTGSLLADTTGETVKQKGGIDKLRGSITAYSKEAPPAFKETNTEVEKSVKPIVDYTAAIEEGLLPSFVQFGVEAPKAIGETNSTLKLGNDTTLEFGKTTSTILIPAFTTGMPKATSSVEQLNDELRTSINLALKLSRVLPGGGVTTIKAGAVSSGGGGGSGGMGFREGGSFMVGGTGSGTDKTPVQFSANRGERVTVETRRQQRTKDNTRATADPNVTVPLKVVNVVDPSLALSAMASAKGQRQFVNTIKDNRNEILSILGVPGYA